MPLDPTANKASAQAMRPEFSSACERCSGLCCVALCFSTVDGFPYNKPDGEPCRHLQADSRCELHSTLAQRGLKGCIAFECFGAGQQLTQARQNGQQTPQNTTLIFRAFLALRQLRELLWYLRDALDAAPMLRPQLLALQRETEALTTQPVEQMATFDVQPQRVKINTLLLQTSELVRTAARKGAPPIRIAGKPLQRGADLAAADLRKADLVGANLRGACLIAANMSNAKLFSADLIGADLRDAQVHGADMIGSLFLTQAQLNQAKGDAATRLPPHLFRPAHW